MKIETGSVCTFVTIIRGNENYELFKQNQVDSMKGRMEMTFI